MAETWGGGVGDDVMLHSLGTLYRPGCCQLVFSFVLCHELLSYLCDYGISLYEFCFLVYFILIVISLVIILKDILVLLPSCQKLCSINSTNSLHT